MFLVISPLLNCKFLEAFRELLEKIPREWVAEPVDQVSQELEVVLHSIRLYRVCTRALRRPTKSVSAFALKKGSCDNFILATQAG